MNQAATTYALKPLHYAIWLMLAFSLTPAWATTENSTSSEPSAPEAPQKSHYEITVGKPVENQAPLPDMVPATVTVHFSDGTSKQYVGGRGWDINKDGQMDMIEVLDEAGQDRAYVFDFDADGRPDFVRVRGERTEKTEAETWQEEIINDIVKDGSLDQDGNTLPPGQQYPGGDAGHAGVNKEDPAAHKDKSFSGLDLGLEMVSTKFDAVDEETHGKAELFTKSHMAINAGYAYFPSHHMSYRLLARVRSMQFEKDASGVLPATDVMLMGFAATVDFHVLDSLSTAVGVGYEQQPFLHAKAANTLAIDTLFIPNLKLDVVWDAWEWSLYSTGMLVALDYGLGGKSSTIEAHADLSYQASIFLQKQFSSFITGVQLDWRTLHQKSDHVEQEQTDIGLQLQFSMLLGGGA